MKSILLLLALLVGANSFSCVGVPLRQSFARPTFQLFAEASGEEVEEKLVDRVVNDLHDSGYKFRIVVIGNGAILETTSVLGPTKKSSISPKTGGRLVTLASEDQSFEFHIKVDEVDNVVFAETAKPIGDGKEKILRICRLMNKEGGSIASLILAEGSDDAAKWFSELKKKHEES